MNGWIKQQSNSSKLRSPKRKNNNENTILAKYSKTKIQTRFQSILSFRSLTIIYSDGRIY